MGFSRKLLLLITLALALTGASDSQALATDFFAEEYAAEIKGEATETQNLTLGELKIPCKKASLAGEMLDESEAITVVPSYSSCVVLGINVTIEMNGCGYVLNSGAETSENVFSGTNDISCPKEQSVKIIIVPGKCEAKIGAQTGLSSVSYQGNVGSEPPDITLKQNLSSIHYTVTKKEGACPFPGTGEKTNGSLSGNLPLRAFSEAAQVGMAQKKEPNAKLCGAIPEVTGACPGGKAYKGTAIQGVNNGGNPSPVTITFLTKGVAVESIECEQSIFTAETSVETGAPRLTAEKVSVSFGACKDGGGKGNACTIEMTNAPATGNISAPPPPFWFWPGVMRVAVTLSVECMKINCIYGTVQENFELQGPGELTTERALLFAALEGTACYEQATWYTKYEVLQPEPLWPAI